MRRSKLAACVMLALGMAVPGLEAQYARPQMTKGVGIDQKLNAPIPLDLNFRDETGQLLPLRTYFGDKPVVLEMVYFNCASLCPMSILESVKGLQRIPLQAGRDYDVVIVSFDPADTPEKAAEKKAEYAQSFGKPGYQAGFHFLTGTQESITRLASAIGWRYRWDATTKQFIHAAGMMVATPEGKLSRYFFGIDYAPADLRMSLVEAAKHRIGSPVDYVLLFCLHYDATQGRYTLAIFNVLKLAAGLTIIGLGFLIYFLMRKDRNDRNPKRRWREVRHAG